MIAYEEWVNRTTLFDVVTVLGQVAQAILPAALQHEAMSQGEFALAWEYLNTSVWFSK